MQEVLNTFDYHLDIINSRNTSDVKIDFDFDWRIYKNVSDIVNTAFLDFGENTEIQNTVFSLLVSLSIPAGRMRLSYRSDPMI